MVKLKKMRLKNYCGYRDSEFDFTNDKGEVKNFAVFFGANGSGKSTLLNAVRMISNATAFKVDPNRDQSLYFNKMIFSENYEPTSQKYKQKLAELMKKVKANDPDNPLYANLKVSDDFGDTRAMEVEGVFETDDGDKTVIIGNEGLVRNDFTEDGKEYCYYVDADHPMEMNKFQLQNTDLADVFLELAKIVYGYPCFFDKSVNIGKDEYFTDFCIEKWGTTVHHKSMSDGEKKICALLKSLSEPDHIYTKDIILIDNVEMHIYFKRHAKMFDSLMQIFPKYQFIVTTHSGTLINHINEEHDGKFLYDLEIYKKKEFDIFNVKENLGMG